MGYVGRHVAELDVLLPDLVLELDLDGLDGVAEGGEHASPEV